MTIFGHRNDYLMVTGMKKYEQNLFAM